MTRSRNPGRVPGKQKAGSDHKDRNPPIQRSPPLTVVEALPSKGEAPTDPVYGNGQASMKSAKGKHTASREGCER